MFHGCIAGIPQISSSWSRFWPCRRENLNKKELEKKKRQTTEKKRSCTLQTFLFVSCTLYDGISSFLFYIWYVWNHKDKVTLTFLMREACTSSENLILQWPLLLQHTHHRHQKIALSAGWSSYLFKETKHIQKDVKSKKFGSCMIEKKEGKWKKWTVRGKQESYASEIEIHRKCKY